MPTLDAAGATLTLPTEVRRHLEVLRLGEGDVVVLFDGSGRQAKARLSSGGAILEATEVALDEGPQLVLLQALPKGAKADEIVRMATELGAHAIHFALTERGVARPDTDRGDKKTARWRKIAEEATRQCERALVPEVYAPAPLREVVARATVGGRKLVAWARGGLPLRELPADGDPIWVAVGPEGGFSLTELEGFDAAGWTRVTLGPHILRVDTAALAALAQLRGLR